MRPRGVHPLLLLGLAVGFFGLLFAGAFAVGDSGVMALVPFAGLLVPLLLGRYVGADRLERLCRARRRLPRAPRVLHVAAVATRPALRSGLVLASGLATRPPPSSISARA